MGETIEETDKRGMNGNKIGNHDPTTVNELCEKQKLPPKMQKGQMSTKIVNAEHMSFYCSQRNEDAMEGGVIGYYYTSKGY